MAMHTLAAESSVDPNEARSLPRAAPASVGVDPAGIAAFIDAVEAQVGGLHSFMLLRHGKVAAEAWWAPYSPDVPHQLFSLTKSFTSTAVGLAVAEGRLSVDDSVVSFFPEALPAKVSDHLASMRIHDLLTMSTGHDTEPNVRSQHDWVRAFLATEPPHPPGSQFLYNTPASHILSAIVQQRTGVTLAEYLRPRLFEPLGITPAKWETSPTGESIGGFGLYLLTEDIAKFGQLYLQRGRWGGRQIVPEAWVEQATRKQVCNDNARPHANNGDDWKQGYGYQFWRCRHDCYRGDGAFGQFCIVMPRQDAVLAITSGVANMAAVMNAAWDHLLPAFRDDASLRDDAGLAARLASLIVPGPEGAPTSATAARLSGKTWRFADNADGIRSATLDFKPDGCRITARNNTGECMAICGTDTWIRGESPFPGNGPAALRGAWTDEHTYTMKVCFYETPFMDTLAWAFDQASSRVVVTRKRNVAFGPTERPDLVGTPG